VLKIDFLINGRGSSRRDDVNLVGHGSFWGQGSG
jgi:hypothetical protein